MTFEESWSVIRQAAIENKHELVLSGSAVKELIEKNGLDKSLFNLVHLNYLNLSHTCLEEIPDDIEKLNNLTNLVLHSNEITKLPKTIAKLEKLKVLDCSRNKLSSLPAEMSNLPNLTTVNFGSNLLTSFPSQAANTKLSVLDLSNNQFESFPDVCYTELAHLSEIHVNGNRIKEIPATIIQLSSLKILNLADNLLTVIPGEVADCKKLKELFLKGNSLADKRLLKLVDQCRSKQVLEYIRQHCPKVNPTSGSSGKSKKGKKGQKASECENVDDTEDLANKLKVLKMTDETPVVKVTKHVQTVRPYISACIVRNLSFTEESFKKFIQLQTKLHDEICQKRNTATIATHDLKLITPGDLTYTAVPPNELKIQPLMRSKIYSGADLFQKLQTEADNLRKEKKRNVYSGIHKYLYLLEGKPLFPCLLNAAEQVISFPPLTNSDISKMSASTDSMFIEVTSSISNQVCRNVLDQFLKELTIQGLGCTTTTAGEGTSEHHELIVEQVKIVDIEGNMKTVYPSRADLHFDDSIIGVTRL